MDIKTLSGVPETEICNALNDAFSEYVIQFQIPAERFPGITRRRGVDYGFSMGAFDGEKLVGFIINGLGIWNGVPTAYDCFTGVICDYKGNGITKSMFEAGMDIFRKKGIERYVLEVITENEKALRIYRKTGFEISREFNIYRQDAAKIKTDADFVSDIVIDSIKDPDWNVLKGFRDVATSWQNSEDSIIRVREDFEVYGAFDGEECVGYIAFETKTGDVAQLGVRKDHRRKGIGSALVRKATEGRGNGYRLSFLNVDSRCDTFSYFAERLGIPLILKQYEMAMDI